MANSTAEVPLNTRLAGQAISLYLVSFLMLLRLLKYYGQFFKVGFSSKVALSHLICLQFDSNMIVFLLNASPNPPKDMLFIDFRVREREGEKYQSVSPVLAPTRDRA